LLKILGGPSGRSTYENPAKQETLTFDPLTLKLVHEVLVSKGPFLPILVFLFVFALGGGTGWTDTRTDMDLYMMGPRSRKGGPIITDTECQCVYYMVNAKSLCHATRNNSTAIDDATLQLFALIICYFKKLLTAARKYINAPGMKMHRL